MAKKNTGTPFEKIVQEIYQALVNYECVDKGYKRIDVQHNIRLIGKSGNAHQIDVYWAFELAGHIHKTIVEVKDWKTPVKKEQLHSFKSLLDDIPGFPVGYFVSKSGFQEGAINFARLHGIKLVQIAEQNDSLKIVFINTTTYYEFPQLSVDIEWMHAENLNEEFLRNLNINQELCDITLLNPNTEKVRLYDLMCIDAVPYYDALPNELHTIEKDLYGSWHWITGVEELQLIKISGYKFQCYNKRKYIRTQITSHSLANYLVTDLLENKSLIFNPLTKEFLASPL